MSRFVHKTDTKLVSYGLDRALGYFVDVERLDAAKDEDPEVEMSTTFGASRGDMLDVLVKHGVRKDHCDAIAMDLPFR